MPRCCVAARCAVLMIASSSCTTATRFAVRFDSIGIEEIPILENTPIDSVVELVWFVVDDSIVQWK